MKTVFITGSSGGFHRFQPCQTYLTTRAGYQGSGLDNMNDYYDVRIKEAHLEGFRSSNYTFIKGTLRTRHLSTAFLSNITRILWSIWVPRRVCDTPSLTRMPTSRAQYDRLLQYSGSLPSLSWWSIWCMLPLASSMAATRRSHTAPMTRVDNPVSLYAATKKSNELMAHAYASSSTIFLPLVCVSLRSMVLPAVRIWLTSVTNKLVKGKTIKIFNYGNCKRDFTYVDDIVEGVVRVMKKAPEKRRRARMICRFRRMPFTTSAISNPENFAGFRADSVRGNWFVLRCLPRSL